MCLKLSQVNCFIARAFEQATSLHTTKFTNHARKRARVMREKGIVYPPPPPKKRNETKLDKKCHHFCSVKVSQRLLPHGAPNVHCKYALLYCWYTKQNHVRYTHTRKYTKITPPCTTDLHKHTFQGRENTYPARYPFPPPQKRLLHLHLPPRGDRKGMGFRRASSAEAVRWSDRRPTRATAAALGRHRGRCVWTKCLRSAQRSKRKRF